MVLVLGIHCGRRLLSDQALGVELKAICRDLSHQFLRRIRVQLDLSRLVESLRKERGKIYMYQLT